MYLGLSGTCASGKDAVAEMLADKGFLRTSLSKELEIAMRAEGIESNREAMCKYADGLRSREGENALALRVIKRIKEENPENATIESIRCPLELETIHQQFKEDFKLLWVDADINIRYERARARKSDKDKTDFAQFKLQEEREMKRKETFMNMEKIKDEADFTIDNSGTYEELKKKVERLCKALCQDRE